MTPPSLDDFTFNDLGEEEINGVLCYKIEWIPNDEDIAEENNLSGSQPDLVASLDMELFAYLNAVGARFPVADPEYDAAKEAAYLDGVRNKLMPSREKERMNFLSKDFDPGNDWWGSKITED